MDAVGLQAHHFDRYPHELSGGQRQRIVLARALILEPDAAGLRRADLGARRLDPGAGGEPAARPAGSASGSPISSSATTCAGPPGEPRGRGDVSRPHRRAGRAGRLFAAPAHPYTQALVSAIPALRDRSRAAHVLQGDPPNPVDVPAGCAFHPRCPLAVARCRAETPPLRRAGGWPRRSPAIASTSRRCESPPDAAVLSPGACCAPSSPSSWSSPSPSSCCACRAIRRC